MLREGQHVVLTSNAVETYGERYRKTVFVIEQWYDHACTPREAERDEHGHPGYDGSTGGYLYDVSIVGSDEEFNNSLYGWELIQVR